MMPAGILTSTLRCDGRLPRPRQAWQGEAMITPRPPHVGQPVVCTNWPRAVCCNRCTRPWPPHVSHRSGSVPGSAPLPWQTSQVLTTSTSTLRVTPNADSVNSSSTVTARSPPRCGRRRPPPPNRSSPKNAPNRSEREPKSMKMVGVERCAVDPGMAEAVVAGTGLVGQHLVRLSRLAEAFGGLRVGIDVRVQLAGEAAERLLDRRVVRSALDAQHLVVVAFRHDRSLRIGMHRGARTRTGTGPSHAGCQVPGAIRCPRRGACGERGSTPLRLPTGIWRNMSAAEIAVRRTTQPPRRRQNC